MYRYALLLRSYHGYYQDNHHDQETAGVISPNILSNCDLESLLIFSLPRFTGNVIDRGIQQCPTFNGKMAVPHFLPHRELSPIVIYLSKYRSPPCGTLPITHMG